MLTCTVPVPPSDIPEPELEQPMSADAHAMITARVPIQMPVTTIGGLFRGKRAMAASNEKLW
jgi:hypothetical protein